MQADGDEIYPCASLDELVSIGRRLLHSNRFLQQPCSDRLVLKSIHCTGFDYEEIRGIFDDAQRLLEDYDNRSFLADVITFIVNVILGFITQVGFAHYEDNDSKLKKKYGFSDERSDRSCIARIYFEGWRLHEYDKNRFFTLRYEYS